MNEYFCALTRIYHFIILYIKKKQHTTHFLTLQDKKEALDCCVPLKAYGASTKKRGIPDNLMTIIGKLRSAFDGVGWMNNLAHEMESRVNNGYDMKIALRKNVDELTVYEMVMAVAWFFRMDFGCFDLSTLMVRFKRIPELSDSCKKCIFRVTFSTNLNLIYLYPLLRFINLLVIKANSWEQYMNGTKRVIFRYHLMEAHVFECIMKEFAKLHHKYPCDEDLCYVNSIFAIINGEVAYRGFLNGHSLSLGEARNVDNMLKRGFEVSIENTIIQLLII